MSPLPKNGMYLTSEDFPQWQDFFTRLVTNSGKYQYENTGNSCGTVSCSASCGGSRSELKSKNITFVVTEQCNLRCTYCYETHKNNRRMSKEVAKQAVDFIFNQELINGYFNAEDHPGVVLEFIGGEPLLEIDLISYITEYFKFKAFELGHPWGENYIFSISSNGILYNTKKVQDFLQRNQGKVSMGISIDGDKALHDSCRIFPDGKGSYDIVEEAVKTWVSKEYIPQTKITLSPYNIQHLNSALKNVWGLGVISAYTNCVYEEGWTLDHAKIMYSQMKELADYLLTDENYTKYFCSLFDSQNIGTPLKEDKNWCGGNGEMLAIGTDGKCYPCIRFMDYSLNNQPSKPIGDIYAGLDDKNENEWLNALKCITMSSQSDEKCNSCPIATGCSLCTGYNYDHFGNPNKRATYICIMHQARILANSYYFNRLWSKLGLDKRYGLNVPKDWALNIISEDEYNYLLSLNGSDE